MAEQMSLCQVVHPILRWGMILSLAMMLIGLSLGFLTGAEDTAVVPLEGIPSGLLDLQPSAFLTLGIVMLIATPLSRVLGSLCVFVKERDRKFILVSLGVLAAVAAAVLLGAA